MTNAEAIAEAARLGVKITRGRGSHTNLYVPGMRQVAITQYRNDIAPPVVHKLLEAARILRIRAKDGIGNQ